VDILFGPRILIKEHREQRKPMLLFVFVGALFKFSVKAPA